MSIYAETVASSRFDPAAPGPSTEFEPWDDLIPAPSLTELAETLAQQGGLDITREWMLTAADLTMRYIKAKDDTQSFPAIKQEAPGGE